MVSQQVLSALLTALVFGVTVDGSTLPITKSSTCPPWDPIGCRHYHENAEYYCKFQWPKQNCPNLCRNCRENECQDRIKECKLYNHHDNEILCKFDWLKKNCRKTCSLCDGTTGEECVDDLYCENYKGYEDFYCQTEWSQKNCRNLCGICGAGSKTTTVAPTTTTTKVPVTEEGSGSGDWYEEKINTH